MYRGKAKRLRDATQYNIRIYIIMYYIMFCPSRKQSDFEHIFETGFSMVGRRVGMRKKTIFTGLWWVLSLDRLYLGY